MLSDHGYSLQDFGSFPDDDPAPAPVACDCHPVLTEQGLVHHADCAAALPDPEWKQGDS